MFLERTLISRDTRRVVESGNGAFLGWLLVGLRTIFARVYRLAISSILHTTLCTTHTPPVLPPISSTSHSHPTPAIHPPCPPTLSAHCQRRFLSTEITLRQPFLSHFVLLVNFASSSFLSFHCLYCSCCSYCSFGGHVLLSAISSM